MWSPTHGRARARGSRPPPISTCICSGLETTDGLESTCSVSESIGEFRVMDLLTPRCFSSPVVHRSTSTRFTAWIRHRLARGHDDKGGGMTHGYELQSASLTHTAAVSIAGLRVQVHGGYESGQLSVCERRWHREQVGVGQASQRRGTGALRALSRSQRR